MRFDEIAAYVRSGEWRGKAGAYGIQGRAGAFVTRIVGSYPAIVGLPLHETRGELQRAVDGLRKTGLTTAAKTAGRVAAEGLIGVAVGLTTALQFLPMLLLTSLDRYEPRVVPFSAWIIGRSWYR